MRTHRIAGILQFNCGKTIDERVREVLHPPSWINERIAAANIVYMWQVDLQPDTELDRECTVRTAGVSTVIVIDAPDEFKDEEPSSAILSASSIVERKRTFVRDDPCSGRWQLVKFSLFIVSECEKRCSWTGTNVSECRTEQTNLDWTRPDQALVSSSDTISSERVGEFSRNLFLSLPSTTPVPASKPPKFTLVNTKGKNNNRKMPTFEIYIGGCHSSRQIREDEDEKNE
jgi:hypothetical protein